MNSNPNGQNVKPENAPGHAPGKDKAWQLYPDGAPHGFFAATRGEEPLELIKLNKNAFVLAYVIAARARWSARFNKYNLQPGEAMLGDYLEYGFTEQEYRTAKAILEKHRFSTFKATNKGTIAKLSDTRLFAISIETTNEPSNGQPTDSQRTGNERVTTINKDIRVEGIEREKEKAASLSPFSDVPKDTRKEIEAFHELYQKLTGYSEIALDMARERQWFEWLQYGITHQHPFTHEDFKLVVKLIREGIANAKSNQGAYKRNQGALKFDNLIGDPGRFEQDLAEARTHFGKRTKPAIDPKQAVPESIDPHAKAIADKISQEIARRDGEISTAIEKIKDDDANWNFSQGVRRCLTRQADLDVSTLQAKRAALKR